MQTVNHCVVYPGRKESGGVLRRFTRICPESSLTVHKQKTPCQPPGLTLVGFISAEAAAPFEQAISLLQKAGRRFEATPKPHFTILGLFAGDSGVNLTQEQIEQISRATEEYFKAKVLGALRLEFDLVRPGIFVGQPEYGDGTVVALASEATEGQVLQCSAELAGHLSAACPTLFGQKMRRPLPGVWCSLGFYDEADFAIDASMFEVLTRLQGFRASLTIERISLVSFGLKSLADAKLVTELRL